MGARAQVIKPNPTPWLTLIGKPPEGQLDGSEGNEGGQSFREVLKILGETPRGIASRCGGGGVVDQAFDAYAALGHLSQLDFVDPARVAVGRDDGADRGPDR
jgi:hypothetical protein